MNCTCEKSAIVLLMGIERCATCGKLAGGDAFVPFGESLPTKAEKRRVVHSNGANLRAMGRSTTSMQRRRAEAVAANLCVVCIKRAPRPNRSTCEECNEAAKERVKRSRSS
jgi:hypothetical protein